MYDLNKQIMMHIELTTKCNSLCPLCSRNAIHNMNQIELTLADIKCGISPEFIKNATFINYCGNYGDPGTSSQLLPILEYFSSCNPTIIQQVRTNAGMRTEQFWKDLGNFYKDKQVANVSELFALNGPIFSVDGLADTNHLYRRNVNWEKVYAHMQAFASTGAYAAWEFLLFEHNQHQVEIARQMAKELGFMFVIKNPIGIPAPVFDENGEIAYYLRKATNISIKNTVKTHIPMSCDTNDIRCTVVLSDYNTNSQECYISAGGYVAPCCFLGGGIVEADSPNLDVPAAEYAALIKERGMEKISIKHRKLEDIITDDGFIQLHAHKSDIAICQNMCGDAHI